MRAAIGDASEVAIVSVVPSWSAAIHRVCADAGLRSIDADAGTIPIGVSIPNPERVGSDRLLGAWTARETWGAPVIVVDCGTATTIDVVDDTGSFVGGAILPGVALGIRSLAADTELLPAVAPRLPAHAIGRDTVEAIQSGAVLGHVAAIEGLLARIIEELGSLERPAVVLTGGAAASLGPVRGVDRRRRRPAAPRPGDAGRAAGGRPMSDLGEAPRPLEGRLVLLGVTGSIAAYKAAELVRLLTAAGAEVQVLMTHTASTFIGPLTLETLSRRSVMLDPLELLPDRRIGHIVAADSGGRRPGRAGHRTLAGSDGQRTRRTTW